MRTKPNVCVLKAPGINCDHETAHAFGLAGGNTRIVLVNELREKCVRLDEFQILAIPGGFSYGDDIGSGKVLANELRSFLKDEMGRFVERQKPIIGICNGFQVLTQAGMLPASTFGKSQSLLAANEQNTFECRPVRLVVSGNSIFLRSFAPGSIIELPVAHGEGRFWAEDGILHSINAKGQVALRYVDNSGDATQVYPANPNGSVQAIAGITDSSGLVLGLMPHPERAIRRTQHPNWRRQDTESSGLAFFKNAVDYVS